MTTAVESEQRSMTPSFPNDILLGVLAFAGTTMKDGAKVRP
jgi:hypothetical protein